MRILIRAEASPKIGLGHLVRSLLIAKKIKDSFPNIEIIFLTGDYSASISKIEENDFKYIMQKGQNEEKFLLSNCIFNKADVIFIDKLYNYSENFITVLSQNIKVVMFHNICDGAHLCNAFIFPAAHIHRGILNDPKWEMNNVQFFEGKEFIVLNEEIINLQNVDKTSAEVETIVVTTGGSDPNGVMLKILNWINKIELSEINIYALIGEFFIHKKPLELLKRELKSNIEIVSYNPRYFINADIAIATFGVSTYELIYLGLPVLSIGHCEVNAKGSHILSKKCQQLIDVGNIDDLTKEKFEQALFRTMDSVKKETVRGCLIDGKCVSRVAEIIYKVGKET